MQEQEKVAGWWFRTAEIRKTLFAGLIGFAIGAAIMALFGYNPITAYQWLFKGSFGNLYGFAESLANATPLILTALTFAVCFRGGLFNIGAEGQLYIGTLAAVSVSLACLPAGLTFLLSLIAAMAAGALWSIPVAILKVFRGVHEVISTIMLNWIGRWFAFWLILHPLTDPLRGEKTISVLEGARFPLLIPGTSSSYGFFIALAAVIVVYLLLWRMLPGFNIRVVGHNPQAASYAGIEQRKVIFLVFIVGGITAGLGGAVHVMGRPPTYAVFSGLSAIMYLGFDGLAVAMIGRNHPIGIVFAAIFFGGLLTGGRLMQLKADVPLEMVHIVEGIIILSIAVPELTKMFHSIKQSILQPLMKNPKPKRR